MTKKRNESIKNHLLWPLLILLILQAVIMAGMILFGGVSIKLKSNEIHILSENTENTRLYLEKETIHQWMNMVNDSGSMAAEIEAVLENKRKSAADISTDYALNRQIVEGIMDKSVAILRRGYGTGIFAVLDGPAAENSPEGTKAGFYIRDSNSGSYTQGYSSLLMERGLPSIANKYGIPLDSFWELGFDMEGAEEACAFYKKPFNAAMENGASWEERMNYAFLCRPFRLSPADVPVITYSVPIILKDGSIVGVFGLEMTVGRLEQLLSADRTDGGQEMCYVLGLRKKGGDSVQPVTTTGYLYNHYFTDQKQLKFNSISEKGIDELTSSDGTDWFASVKKLEVYSYNTPFEQEEWVLAGMARKDSLLSFYNYIRRMLIGSMMFPVIFSLLGVFVIGRIVTRPISSLIKELRAKSGAPGLVLTRVHISEIDELTGTIEQLSADVERSASKISTILDHAEVLIGVFEYQSHSDTVFCSRSVFEILNFGEIVEPYCYLPVMQFNNLIMQALKQVKQEGGNYLFQTEKDGNVRWVRLILDHQEEGVILGVLCDVTADVLEKEKLERERNYDLLTSLYNRRAFREKTADLMAMENVKAAAVIMWDLDNLKYINDTYGHDEGDRYIRLFADCLRRLEPEGAVVSRYSGDEFVTLIYQGSMEEIQSRIRDFMEYMKKCTLDMEGGYRIPVRVSGGISWYPSDAVSFDTLLTYADFAMYTVKHSVKGILMEFDKDDYDSHSYMLAGREELNQMLETRKVRFAFQPVLNRDGSIYGYELLMRPQFINLKGIQEVLNLARAQAKLRQMEALTWFAGLEAVRTHEKDGETLREAKLFINSIASVSMSEAEIAQFEEQFEEYLPRLVVELTEGEPTNRSCLRRKLDAARKWNALVAIDDFGAGYNSESILLDMEPDIIKIDINLIQHIHEDTNRQLILNSIMDFAGKNRITVLAEGVETKEELEYLIQRGVNLFQGFYIGRPEMEMRPVDPYIVRKMQEFAEKTKLSDK